MTISYTSFDFLSKTILSDAIMIVKCLQWLICIVQYFFNHFNWVDSLPFLQIESI